MGREIGSQRGFMIPEWIYSEDGLGFKMISARAAALASVALQRHKPESVVVSTRDDLATILGLSRATVYRAFSELEAEGLIVAHGRDGLGYELAGRALELSGLPIATSEEELDVEFDDVVGRYPRRPSNVDVKGAKGAYSALRHEGYAADEVLRSILAYERESRANARGALEAQKMKPLSAFLSDPNGARWFMNSARRSTESSMDAEIREVFDVPGAPSAGTVPASATQAPSDPMADVRRATFDRGVSGRQVSWVAHVPGRAPVLMSGPDDAGASREELERWCAYALGLGPFPGPEDDVIVPAVDAADVVAAAADSLGRSLDERGE